MGRRGSVFLIFRISIVLQDGLVWIAMFVFRLPLCQVVRVVATIDRIVVGMGGVGVRMDAIALSVGPELLVNQCQIASVSPARILFPGMYGPFSILNFWKIRA